LASRNLSSNFLTEIPSAVFQMSKLKNLSMEGNPLKSPTVSATQYAFLQKITTLTLSTDGTALSCESSKQKPIGGVSICVLDDSEFAKTVTSNAPAASSTDSSASSSSSSSSSSSVAMIGGVAGGVVVVALIGVVLWVSSKRRKRQTNDGTNSKHDPSIAYADERTPTGTPSKKGSQYSAGSKNSSGKQRSGGPGGGGGTTLLSIWNDPDLLSVQLNYDDIEDVKAIGSGAYGVVWLVKYRGTQLMASKRLKPGESDRQRTQDFLDEIKLVAKFDHPHVVKFVGAAWTVESDVQALFEYMENGDLKTYLLDAYTPKHWTQEKVQIAIGIIEALVYVHSFNPPLVHRDLKSRNVLLSEDLEAKLTDFGVSRFRSEDNTMTAGVGTAKWLAPEVISGQTDYDQSADIYAFGVVLSEVDTHETPFADVKGTNGNPLPEIALLQMVSKGEIQPSFSSSCPENIRELAMRCLAFNAKERPSAVEIAYLLRTIQKSLYTSL
ncbi:Tkl protein kinase, partial [Globisporangium polare]